MFFVGGAHLIYMIFFPGSIGPYASADRIYSQGMFFFYLVLLFAVVIHASAGLYRVGIKWGLFLGKNPRAGRQRSKALARTVAVLFLILGTLALFAYGKLGYDHRDHQGERYSPATHADKHKDRL